MYAVRKFYLAEVVACCDREGTNILWGVQMKCFCPVRQSLTELRSTSWQVFGPKKPPKRPKRDPNRQQDPLPSKKKNLYPDREIVSNVMFRACFSVFQQQFPVGPGNRPSRAPLHAPGPVDAQRRRKGRIPAKNCHNAVGNCLMAEISVAMSSTKLILFNRIGFQPKHHSPLRFLESRRRLATAVFCLSDGRPCRNRA